jgi:DNA-binding NtrC family response regulator
MKIQSAEGVGTTIELFLPWVSEAAATDTPRPSSASAAVPFVPSDPAEKRRILIVDDEPALAELVRAWIKEEGHTAVMAHSADDALALLAVRKFDILLTDIVMPGQLDGIGLAQEASVLCPAMKILLMSGYSRETASHRADIPWALLVKPFRKEELDAVLAKAFRDSGFAQLA